MGQSATLAIFWQKRALTRHARAGKAFLHCSETMSYSAYAGVVLFRGRRERSLKDMNTLKTLSVLAFSSALLAGCDANKDDASVEADTPSPAVEMPAPPPEDTTYPADEPEPSMSDTIPTDEQPPPPEPPPPPGD